MLNRIQNLDWSILHWIQATFKCTFLDFLIPKITLLGNAGMIWIITGIVLLISKKYRKHGITLLLALLAGALIGNVCLKNLVARSRPCWLENVELLIANPRDYSFPSGHTLSAVIGAGLLISANQKFGAVAIPPAALIIFSRLYLYVHFPTDVLAAILLGIAIAQSAIRIMKNRFSLCILHQ